MRRYAPREDKCSSSMRSAEAFGSLCLKAIRSQIRCQWFDDKKDLQNAPFVTSSIRPVDAEGE